MKANYESKSERELLAEILSRLDSILERQNNMSRNIPEGIGYIDTADLIEVSHISRKTVTTWIKSKLLRAAKIGGKLFFKVTDITDMMQEHFGRV